MGDYLPLLRELASLDPPAFIFGGIAEDVLLNGEIDSSHEDVDLLVPRDQLEISLKQLGALGFGDFAVYYEPRRGRPLVMGSLKGDLAVELSLVDYDATGSPYFAVRTDAGAVAISMPQDMFDWPPTNIHGVAIRTLSPLALIQTRAGLTATGAFGPPRPGKDAPRQVRLIDAFFPEAVEDSLLPPITSIAEE